MTSLYYLHEPGVSENLEVRYLEDKIMSYIGRVLVVCNPFKRITMPNPQDYVGKRLDANPPHNYAIADGAYQDLTKSGGELSQSIIISGESGAGKTESAKIVMNYITTVSAMAEGEEDLPKRILAANPILEAFGNGKTTRNWNSSRFGKFTQLEFEDGKCLCGATVETYLLEKSRVVFQGAGERNVRTRSLSFARVCCGRANLTGCG
jgi:myosin heavy subunit